MTIEVLVSGQPRTPKAAPVWRCGNGAQVKSTKGYPVSIADLKARLHDVQGIETLTLTLIGGRACYGFAGKIAAVDPMATDKEIEEATRKAASMTAASAPEPVSTPAAPKASPMTNPAPGGFAAGLKAILDNAKAGVAKAQADGLAKVNAAATKLNEAAAHTAAVTDNMAQTINDQADAVLAELGQISNLPPAGT